MLFHGTLQQWGQALGEQRDHKGDPTDHEHDMSPHAHAICCACIHTLCLCMSHLCNPDRRTSHVVVLVSLPIHTPLPRRTPSLPTHPSLPLVLRDRSHRILLCTHGIFHIFCGDVLTIGGVYTGTVRMGGRGRRHGHEHGHGHGRWHMGMGHVRLQIRTQCVYARVRACTCACMYGTCACSGASVCPLVMSSVSMLSSTVQYVVSRVPPHLHSTVYRWHDASRCKCVCSPTTCRQDATIDQMGGRNVSIR